MGAAEQLAKMTAHGVQITGEGFGGEVEITAQDVAAALAGMVGVGYDFVLLKYCDDRSVVQRLVSDMTRFVLYHSPGPQLTEELAEAIAVEVIADRLDEGRCTTCNGTGTYRSKDCAGCKGTGTREKSERKRSEAMKLSRDAFKKWGAEVFRFHSAQLAEWEAEALYKVRRRLR